MSNLASDRNIGAFVTLRQGLAHTTLLAAGSGDNTTATGPAVDRTGVGYPHSEQLAVFYSATLASGATLTLTSKIRDSADNTTYADFATEAATVVATGPSGGGVVTGTHVLNVDLTGARRYVEATVLPDLSAAGTDTAYVEAAHCFAGAAELAATA